ncbi:MAG TPA: hypothetical protein VF948_12855 [Methylomirabilota bacterium]
MACNQCENTFQLYQTVVTSIVKSGTNALLFVQNQGRNIAEIRRIILCYTSGAGATTLFLRPPGHPITWTFPSDTLEPGATGLYYQLNNLPAGTIVQAQADYVELDGRSRSCPTTM